uniref:Anhydro-N-acetylmuramic acid kinase n=1 Tax=Candidatus Kentrum sp. DK TaxID=2126562 RepID=A0A450RUJ8_9GAMM|nr:MAG: anhydro-N-acetylmuramic acid kinase [Candidatus Kentron sp. DK]
MHHFEIRKLCFSDTLKTLPEHTTFGFKPEKMKESNLFIGVLSGTSMDGVDVGLVEFGASRPVLVASRMHPMPRKIRERLMAVCTQTGRDTVDELAELDALLGHLFADAVLALQEQTGLRAAAIRAIGSHGQTVRHRPHGANMPPDGGLASGGDPAGSDQARVPFTLQIADPNIIAERTGITTVADFRRRDMAAGGQGAPLTPGFHQAMFQSARADRAVVNIGGIINVTILPAGGGRIIGFDTGPGNALLDTWAETHLGTPMDTDGHWARQGRTHAPLLARFRADPYFSLPPPKTSGREYFNRDWLDSCIADVHPAPSPVDVQRTLCDLDVTTLRDAILQWAPGCREVFLCGGGARNPLLREGINAQLPGCRADTTACHGIDPDWVEAMAFAWLARQRLTGLPGNVPSVTGARHPAALGAVYPGSVSSRLEGADIP